MSIIDSILSIITPNEASAEVNVPDKSDPVNFIIKAIESGAVLEDKDVSKVIYKDLASGKSNPSARYLYKMILKAAKDDPDTGTVRSKGEDLALESAGYYDRNKKDIHIKQQGGLDISKYPTHQAYQNTLSHELLHFLTRELSDSTDQQHAFIRNVLGVPTENVTFNDLEKGVPFTSLPGFTPLNKDVYERWKNTVFNTGNYTDENLYLKNKTKTQRFIDWFFK